MRLGARTAHVERPHAGRGASKALLSQFIELDNLVLGRFSDDERTRIAPERLGTTDDCGFAPFADDTSTPREVAFAKIRARVEGTALASREARRLSPAQAAPSAPAAMTARGLRVRRVRQ